MRKKGIILLLALTGLFISCNDAIDIKQPGEQNNEYDVFRNAADIKRGISGIYIALPGESEIAFSSVFTDEVSIGRDNGGQGLISGEYGFFMQPGNAYATGFWDSYYGIINRVNRLIILTDDLLETASGDELRALKDNKAELLGLRAYANLKLFSYYTPDYTNPAGLSIMKVDFVPSATSLTEHVGRSTVSEISKFIIDDIDEALATRQSTWNQLHYYYLTAGVLNSMKVKLYSMTQNYTEMIPLAEDILTGGVYRFATASEYVSMFEKDPNQPSSELIFKLARPLGSGGAVASAWYSGAVGINGSFFYEMGRSLYNSLDELDPSNFGTDFTVARNDVRYKVNLQTGTSVATNYNSLPQAQYVAQDILLIGKYKGQSGAFPASQKNDIPVIRISDIALLLAEARATNGQIALSSTDPDDIVGNYSTVANIIYNIRYFRSNNGQVVMPTITSTASAFDAILNERKVEFAFEGHRYLDMKRLGQRANSLGFQRYAKDCIVNGTCDGLPADSYKLTMPIPTTELNSNSIIRGQQNPGY